MADRKKVQKIRTKRTVKFKAPKNNSAKSEKKVSNKTQSIRMNSENSKTYVYSKKPEPQPVRSEADTRKKSLHSDNNIKNRTAKKSGSLSVIDGRRDAVKKKRLFTVCISAIIIISILIFCLTSPTGPIERITNAFAVMGGGEYPTVLNGTKILSVQTVNNKTFALTNSHLSGYNYSGKNFLLLQHNFSNPVLDVSQERVVVYNRESNKFIIANNSGSLFEQSLEQAIFCADISDNGSVAFVCESASYAAQVVVFDKNMEQYFTWYLADGLVSDITVSNNGKYIALAVLKVENGIFSSQIYCLDTSKKDPVYVKELTNETVLKIESVSSSDFVFTSNKKVSFVDWKTGELENKNNFNAPSYFNNVSGYYLALFGEANHSDIVLFDSTGEIEHQFEYNGIIDDISVFDETVFILSGNKVIYFNFENTNEKIINLESKSDYILGVEDGLLSINNINIDLLTIENE